MNAQDELVEAEAEVARARAALAEQKRAENKTALKEAIARGRELTAELDRVTALFRGAGAEADALGAQLKNLNDRAKELAASEPNKTQDFPSEEDQAAWERESKRVARQHETVRAELQTRQTLRESYRMAALNAASALEAQRQVVRNLRELIEDPLGERQRKGWMGGVAVPF